MHRIIRRDMWHLRAETFASASAVFASFWAQHEPFEGRDTCESLSEFHLVLGATRAALRSETLVRALALFTSLWGPP